MNLTHIPDEFKSGVRIVMRMLRNKDGGLAKPDHSAKKFITDGVYEWNNAVAELVRNAQPNERIYASLERRDMVKAIHEFKRRQLDADLYDNEAKLSFYRDIKNRFISCLASPPCRAERLFLIDCDSGDEFRIAKAHDIITENFIYEYPTKNGFHIIVKPFNPKLLTPPLDTKVQKNALILVGW